MIPTATRRDVFRTALTLAISKTLESLPERKNKFEIWAENHTLAEESASGYEKLADAHGHPANLLILPAVRQLTFERAWELRKLAPQGRWILLESGLGFSSTKEHWQQASVLQKVFGIRTRLVVDSVGWRGDYVEYEQPVRQMVRPFGAVTVLESPIENTLAHWKAAPVSAWFRIGSGGLVFLGSALGMGLNTGEKQAWAVGAALIDACSARSIPISGC